MKTIILLDIDETLIIKETTLNQALINALKAQGQTEVYLFSYMMQLDSIIMSLMERDQDITPTSISRAELIYRLTQNGITVKEVVTLIDVAYNQGIGTPYRNLHEPLARRAFPEYFSEPFTDTRLTLEALKAGQDLQYIAHFEEIEKLQNQAMDYNRRHFKTSLSKRRMFSYLFEQLVETGVITTNESVQIVFADDRQQFLNDVEEEVKQKQSQYRLNYIPILVTQEMDEGYYKSKIPKQTSLINPNRFLNKENFLITGGAFSLLALVGASLVKASALSTSLGPIVWTASLGLSILGLAMLAGVAAYPMYQRYCIYSQNQHSNLNPNSAAPKIPLLPSSLTPEKSTHKF